MSNYKLNQSVLDWKLEAAMKRSSKSIIAISNTLRIDYDLLMLIRLTFGIQQSYSDLAVWLINRNAGSHVYLHYDKFVSSWTLSIYKKNDIKNVYLKPIKDKELLDLILYHKLLK